MTATQEIDAAELIVGSMPRERSEQEFLSKSLVIARLSDSVCSR